MAWHAKAVGGYDRTSQEAIDNANEIYNIFSNNGYSDNSIYALIGAFQAECDLNPWQWEGVYSDPNDVPTYNEYLNWSLAEQQVHGYGLPQFTPANVYISGGSSYSGYAPNFKDSAGNVSDGNAQTLFMVDQIPTDWYLSSAYHSYFADIGVDSTVGENMTLNDFKLAQGVTLMDLSVAFFTNYLRPASIEVADRFLDDYYGSASYWYEYFSGHPPTPPTPPTPTRSTKMPLWMMLKKIH